MCKMHKIQVEIWRNKSVFVSDKFMLCGIFTIDEFGLITWLEGTIGLPNSSGKNKRKER